MRDGWGLIGIRTGVCPPPARMSVFLDPWGEDVFQSAPCRGIRVPLSLENGVACLRAAFHLMNMSRYEVSSAIWLVGQSGLVSLGIIFTAYSLYVLVMLVGI